MAIEIPEGSGRAKLRGVLDALGKLGGMRFEFATVTAPLPSIRVKVDNCPIELDADDLVICEHLTQHKRTASINGGAPVEIEYEASLSAGDRVVVASINDGQLYVVIDRIGGG
ncbi:DUF2577 domain-containing protein [Cohnella mopanensis]|uniref:DUF2577 domain-containing protein n=1 Tax=Cohnella mopanensis TaxID=2911966 RepID=UPI001EF8B64F|nr:DUF2577 domain-containing protein [Cohnella mopanensis]